MEIWEPKLQPPHPSTVSDLSKNTQKIMKALEKNWEAVFMKNKSTLAARTPHANAAREDYYQQIYASRFGGLPPSVPPSLPSGSQTSSSMPPPNSIQSSRAECYKYRPQQTTSWSNSQPFPSIPNNYPISQQQYGRNMKPDGVFEMSTSAANPSLYHSGTSMQTPSKPFGHPSGHFGEPQTMPRLPQQETNPMTGYIRQPYRQCPETVTKPPQFQSYSAPWQSQNRLHPPLPCSSVLSNHVLQQISQIGSLRKYNSSPVMDFGSDEEGQDMTQSLTQQRTIFSPHTPHFPKSLETEANKRSEINSQSLTQLLQHTPNLHRSNSETIINKNTLDKADEFIDLTLEFDSPLFESPEINLPAKSVMEVDKPKEIKSKQSYPAYIQKPRKPPSPKQPSSEVDLNLRTPPHRSFTPGLQNMKTPPRKSISSKLQANTEGSSKHSKRRPTHQFEFSNKKNIDSKQTIIKSKNKCHGNISKAKAKLIESILQPNSQDKNISCNDRHIQVVAKKVEDKKETAREKSQEFMGKKSKKKFIAPFKSQQSQPISIEASEHETFKMTTLSHETCSVLEQQIKQKPPIEICITIMYKEGNCQLSRTCDDVKKHTKCSPKGLMLAVLDDTDPVTFYFLPGLQENACLDTQKSMLNTILLTPCRKVCFKSQELFVYLIHVFNFQYHEVSLIWVAIDPLIGCWLLNPDQPPTDFNEVLKFLKVNKNQENSTKSQVRTCKNLILLSQAAETMYQKLVDQELWRVFIDLESKITSILAVMEMEGIPADKHVLKDIGSNLELKIKSLQSQANKLMRVPVLLTSPQQLRKILYDQLKLDSKIKIPMTLQGGGKSTSEPVLKLLESLHPLPGIILEFRHCQKLKSTYVDGILQFVSGGKLYTTWEQIGTSTGRVISRDPNVQAIPKQSIPGEREDNEVCLRSAFKSKAGYSFLAADFQHIELRLLAHFAQDKALSAMFAQTEHDVFQLLARQWLGLSNTREVTNEQREHTKRVVYSVMYGAGAGKLEQVLKIDAEEARHILSTFSAKFPQIRNFSKFIVRKAKDQGYLTSLSGRRRFFPNIGSADMKIRAQSERQAMNFIIQGSAADVCKAAMIATEHTQRQASPPLDAKLLLQIHDELIWQVPDSQLSQFKEVVQKAMEGTRNQFKISLPLPVALGSGKTWADLQ